jgi:homoserine kinase type II
MAVYTEVPVEELEEFVAQYDIGDVVSFKGIAEGVENSNYVLQTDRGTYILTLYEKRVAKADLPFFLGLMDHLAAKGIACATPVHARDGKALRELCDRPAAIVTFLNGVCASRRITLAQCAELGRTMAEMHLAGQSFALTRRNDLSLDGWRRLFDATKPRADEIVPGLAAEIETELGALASSWPGGLPSGVIHADLFPDNVFFLGAKLSGVIDFYFACNDYLAYDLAVCLNAWCFEPDASFNATKALQMYSSYDSVRKLTAEERAATPILARGAALRFLLTRLYDWINTPPGALVNRKDPKEYLARLRFHRGVKGPGAYGLA